jgi:hypothetical protein
MTDVPSLLILTFSPIRSDPRVLKQVELFKGKYRVFTCGYGDAPDGVDNHFALPADSRGWSSDKLGLLTRRYGRVYDGMTAVAAARRVLTPGAFDVVLANDLNTLPLALELKPRLGVHADLHEFAPREKEADPKWRLAVAPFMRWLCRRYLPMASSITTVSPGIAEAYAQDYGVSVDVVTNAAPYTAGEVRPAGQPLRLVHSGAAQRYRQLDRLVEAMRDAPHGTTLDMIVMPNEPDYLEELKNLAAEVPAVRFRDPVPYTELVRTMSEYDASIVFFPPTTFNLKHTLPNKFFEAVQARIGLITGPSPAMVPLMEEYRLGVVTRDFSTSSLREALHGLTADEVSEWKKAADAAARPLSAESQVLAWQRAVDDIAGSQAARA